MAASRAFGGLLGLLACHGGAGLLAVRTSPGPESFSTSLRELPPEERLKKVLPLGWVHVPKVGATFMNAVMHLPGVCPTLKKEWLCSRRNPTCSILQFQKLGATSRFGHKELVPETCPGVGKWGFHFGMATEYEHGLKGRAFAMFRQPEQRLISAFYNPGSAHGWNYSLGKPSMVEYAEVAQGTAVRLLTRDSSHMDHRPPTDAEVRSAVKHLREGFAFVGLTERYELSICLLHAMFGGQCDGREFSVFHTGSRHRRKEYDIAPLKGFRDRADGAVYSEAVRIFEDNLKAYNVSMETCRPCFRQARLSSSQLKRRSGPA